MEFNGYTVIRVQLGIVITSVQYYRYDSRGIHNSCMSVILSVLFSPGSVEIIISGLDSKKPSPPPLPNYCHDLPTSL